MASSTAPASHAGTLPGPPPTPTSLMDLPASWLLQLVTSSALDKQRGALSALFRTCTFFRDAVLQNRTAVATFKVPLPEEDFPAELERLSNVARRSSRVHLQFEGECDDYDRPAAVWMETEPHVTHLLVCAMAQLGGEQPLACIKEIRLRDLEHTALVPAWVRVLCPNVTKLELICSNFPLDLPPPALPHLHLQLLDCNWFEGPPATQSIRQQLSALPSLSALTLFDMGWAEEDEQQARRLISSTVTRLELSSDADEQQSAFLLRLLTQFPRLRELDIMDLQVDDLCLEVLRSMPHLERLRVCGFRLKCSHAHRTWQLQQLTACDLDVDAFARLPLESIQAISFWSVVNLVNPSTDAAAVARVTAAVRRWGGLRPDWCISGSNVAALLTTLGPFIAALPAAQQQRVRVDGLQGVTSTEVQQLGQQLPASVTHLELRKCSLAADAWPSLLPSLPTSVVEVRLSGTPTEQQVVAVCQAAVRPIKVLVSHLNSTDLSQQDLDRIASSLARGAGGSGEQQQKQGSLVTLVLD